MAHNINFNERTGRYSFFSVQQKAWHGLGQIVEQYPTSEEAIKYAGLDYEVVKSCHVLKKVYTFYINTKIRLQFKYNPKIDLQSPFFCNNFSIYNLPF